MFRRRLRRYQKYGWHANCSACSVLRSCRSKSGRNIRRRTAGNSSPSNFVTRPRRTSRTKSRGYARRGLSVGAYVACDRFPLPIHLRPPIRGSEISRCMLISNEGNIPTLYPSTVIVPLIFFEKKYIFFFFSFHSCYKISYDRVSLELLYQSGAKSRVLNARQLAVICSLNTVL